jgi:hypothetical protein
MRKHFIFTSLFLANALIFNAQIERSQCLQSQISQYQKVEWLITLKGTWNNPYEPSDIALDMHITTPSGKKLILPCFYQSGNSNKTSLWMARFTPREAGTYSYLFELQEDKNIVSTLPKAELTVIASNAKGFLNPHNLWTLQYDNGDLFRGIGENICWESRDNDDAQYFKQLHEDKRFNYDFMLKKLATNGGNFFRTWMIYWNLPVDWKTVSNNSRYQNSTSVYNESGMKRLDHLVELCDSLGIHMMLALESHVGLMGDGWKMSSYNIANGGFAHTPLEFFTLPEARQQYKNKLRLMVARYGYSPAIGAWEFFNEIDNVMYAGKPEERIPDAVITAWHDEMSSYLKSIDPYQHIVTTSISHRDVAGLNDLAHIDINQKHIYKNTGGIPETLRSYTQKHNKPYIIGESGYEWDWSKNFNDFAGEMDSDFKRALWLGLFNPTPVLPMSWWWEFFENRGMMGYFNAGKTINESMLKAGKGHFEAMDVKTNQNGLEVYSVRCGKKNFVYLFNSGESCTGIELTTTQIPKGNAQLMVYNDETNQYNTLNFKALNNNTIKLERLTLPAKSNTILIWE